MLWGLKYFPIQILQIQTIMSNSVLKPVNTNPKRFRARPNNKKWEQHNRYLANNAASDKPSRYFLSMFPYPVVNCIWDTCATTRLVMLSRYYRG